MGRTTLLIVLLGAACGGRVASVDNADSGPILDGESGSDLVQRLTSCPSASLVVSGPPVLPGPCGTAPPCQVTTFEPCVGELEGKRTWTIWSCTCTGTWACSYVNSGPFICHPGGPGWSVDAGGE
jgi:hypothetical protein